MVRGGREEVCAVDVCLYLSDSSSIFFCGRFVDIQKIIFHVTVWYAASGCSALVFIFITFVLR